jgi:hypothetical protein
VGAVDRQHQINRFTAARILTAVVVTAGGWMLFDTLSAPVSASASTLSSQAVSSDEPLLGGLLDSVSPVVDSVDGHVQTVADLVSAPAPVDVAETLDAVDSSATHAVAAVPIVDNVVTPVVAVVVEPIARPILEPVVDQVVAPVLGAVVPPVVAAVIAPISPSVPAGISSLDPVLTPATPLTNVQTAAFLTLSQEPRPPVGTPVIPHRLAPQAPTSWTAVDGVPSADVALMTGSHQPTGPALPTGDPLASAVVPGSAGSSAAGAGSGSGPTAATVLPAGLLPAPELRFHSSLRSSDELPATPSFDPGSTPG